MDVEEINWERTARSETLLVLELRADRENRGQADKCLVSVSTTVERGDQLDDKAP